MFTATFLLKIPSERAALLASGQLHTIHSSALRWRGSGQHYAMACVTLLHVCNVIFSFQRDASHYVNVVSMRSCFPLTPDACLVPGGVIDWTALTLPP